MYCVCTMKWRFSSTTKSSALFVKGNLRNIFTLGHGSGVLTLPMLYIYTQTTQCKSIIARIKIGTRKHGKPFLYLVSLFNALRMATEIDR